jgi:hypothetical protein
MNQQRKKKKTFLKASFVFANIKKIFSEKLSGPNHPFQGMNFKHVKTHYTRKKQRKKIHYSFCFVGSKIQVKCVKKCVKQNVFNK